VDVVLYPFKSETLVVQAKISHTTLGLVRGTALPTECAQTVIEAHIDDLAIGRVSRCGEKSRRISVLVS
jgi:hypothetical protein